MKLAIVGYGLQGQSVYEYYHHKHEITICDQNEKLIVPEDAKSQLGPNYLDNLNRFDLIFRSPSIHPRQIISNNSKDIVNKITSNTNEFLKLCPTNNTIGITGTKGKGTTTTLISLMLKEIGFRVHTAGNIGLAPLNILKENIHTDDWVVLELANFQTIDLKLATHYAVCLMVVPEHLNWHLDLQEYLNAKKRLFDNQSDQDIAIYFKNNPNSSYIVSQTKARKIPYYIQPGAYVNNDQIIIDKQTICQLKDIKLKGQHNLENICAAITTVWQIAPNPKAIKKVLEEFGGLENRLELVRVINQISFINDSFGTTPETAIVAIEAYPINSILILGGSSKNSDFTSLAQTIKKYRVKKVILIGQEAKNIQQALDKVNYHNYLLSTEQSMTKIVNQAYKLAEPGDNVLLSTACASFDMFKDYIDRGQQFKEAVLKLQ